MLKHRRLEDAPAIEGSVSEEDDKGLDTSTVAADLKEEDRKPKVNSFHFCRDHSKCSQVEVKAPTKSSIPVMSGKTAISAGRECPLALRRSERNLKSTSN